MPRQAQLLFHKDHCWYSLVGTDMIWMSFKMFFYLIILFFFCWALSLSVALVLLICIQFIFVVLRTAVVNAESCEGW